MTKFMAQKMIVACLFAGVMGIVLADVEVVDAYKQTSAIPSAPSLEKPVVQNDEPVSIDNRLQDTEKAGNSDNDANVLNRLNQMEKEIRELRGQLEVQQHDLKQLSRQQRDYYEDIDTRLQKQTSGNAASSPAMPLQPDVVPNKQDQSVPAPAATPATPNSPSAEKSRYDDAFALIQARNFVTAEHAFNRFLQSYPDGKLVPNAHYWLGELYLQDKKYSAALTEFKKVTANFPAHNKAADANLKIGYVYIKMGQTEKARKQFLKVTTEYPVSASARIAATRLAHMTDS